MLRIRVFLFDMGKSFTLSIDSLCILDKMNNEQAGQFIKLIYHYQLTGNKLDCDFWMDMAIMPFIYQFKKELDTFKNAETYVYYIRLTNSCDDFIKIGISYFLKQRYSDYERAGYIVNEILVEKYNNRVDAEIAELLAHNKFNLFKYTPIDRFGGYTECFSLDVLTILK